jgi:hypothetical protein
MLKKAHALRKGRREYEELRLRDAMIEEVLMAHAAARYAHLVHRIDECYLPRRPGDGQHHSREASARAHVYKLDCRPLAVRPESALKYGNQRKCVFDMALQYLCVRVYGTVLAWLQ